MGDQISVGRNWVSCFSVTDKGNATNLNRGTQSEKSFLPTRILEGEALRWLISTTAPARELMPRVPTLRPNTDRDAARKLLRFKPLRAMEAVRDVYSERSQRMVARES
jgi:hypothetical protein